MPSSDEPAIRAVPSQDNQYTSLQEALDVYRISEPLAPTWFPDGYECVTVDVTEFSMSTDFCAFYENRDLLISITITQYQDANYDVDTFNAYEKDATQVITYRRNGNLHYIFENNDRIIAAWCVDKYTCAIKTDITVEEVEKWWILFI